MGVANRNIDFPCCEGSTRVDCDVITSSLLRSMPWIRKLIPILFGLILERALLDTEKSLLGLSEEWFTTVERGMSDNRDPAIPEYWNKALVE